MRAAGQGTDAGDQHREVEWLGQVVVGAEPEPVHQVLAGCRGGKHEHPAAAPGSDQPGADLVAVDSGQIPVEQDHVVVGGQCAFQPGRPVDGDVHGHLRSAQAGSNRLGHLGVILDHEHPVP